MNAKKYFLTRPFFQEFENGCKVTFGALQGAVAFKKIIKVKPTLVQVLPTLISKKNHVLSAANHSSRELERRTNLALQSSPEDFKSWDETLWWRNYSFVKNCNCWFAMLPLSKMTWFNIEKKSLLCVSKLSKIWHFVTALLLFSREITNLIRLPRSTIYSFFWWFWCKKRRSEVLRETWKLDCYLFAFCFFSLHYTGEKKLKHKKRKREMTSSSYCSIAAVQEK